MLASYQRNWFCVRCGTCNAPDYERCQECLADSDGNLPEDEMEALDARDAAERADYGVAGFARTAITIPIPERDR